MSDQQNMMTENQLLCKFRPKVFHYRKRSLTETETDHGIVSFVFRQVCELPPSF